LYITIIICGLIDKAENYAYNDKMIIAGKFILKFIHDVLH